MLSRFVALSVSLILKVSPLQNDTTWTMYCVEVLEHDVDSEVSQGPGSSLEGTVSHLEVDRKWPDSFSGSFSDYTSCNLWYAYAAGADGECAGRSSSLSSSPLILDLPCRQTAR